MWSLYPEMGRLQEVAVLLHNKVVLLHSRIKQFMLSTTCCAISTNLPLGWLYQVVRLSKQALLERFGIIIFLKQLIIEEEKHKY